MFVPAAHALDSATIRQLKALSPGERLEQRCDMEAMSRIAKDNKTFRPDKVIAYTFSQTHASGNKLSAPGAVFRSREEWYHLKYSCETGNQHLDIKHFTYQIGPMVPKSKWKQYYLYN
ncbi:DUF930 domain-containing protein [Allorhizobium sp. BGMRC 0089]|nr:DUF930 domain-containing protein [Allorhizobium sonneratiae]MCM2291883.1 DUF930 domain-containing protein [Allorhizobium sonneratiae]